MSSGCRFESDIEQLALENEAWMADDDIRYYDFSSHGIYLKSDIGSFFGTDIIESGIFDPVSRGKPFVVVANGQRCYLRSLHSAVQSSLPVGPHLSDFDVGTYPNDVILIRRADIYGLEESVRARSRSKSISPNDSPQELCLYVLKKGKRGGEQM